MRLELGRRADYAVRAVVDLARHHAGADHWRKSREIAEAMDIPRSYLPQVLGALVRHGIVDSVAGPEGGYRLQRAPADISLLEVIAAADGELVSRKCVLRGGPCRWDDVCAVHEPWSAAQLALRDELAATSLHQITMADAALQESDDQVDRLSPSTSAG